VVKITTVKGVGDGGAEVVVRSRWALSLVNGGVSRGAASVSFSCIK
jgi:hypothetical protein